MTEIPRTIKDILDSIDDEIKKGRPIPVLILVYSAIDNISFLTNMTHKKGRNVFKDWVKKWMLQKYPLACNETDIYSARCGLLHRQSGISDLTLSGKAKQIWYTHGTANDIVLQTFIIHIGQEPNAVAVKIEDLIKSFKNGLIDCLTEVNKDVNWKKSFNEKLNDIFGTIPSEL
jgi:hypothetical protein